jgi:2-phospho-L-lactate guanylyltransferase (CobY/MobA/RfbA family)
VSTPLSELITPLVFVGGARASPVEALLADAQEAIARDLLDRLQDHPAFAPAIVAAASAAFADSLRQRPVQVVLDADDFHFGRALAGLIERFAVRRAFYVGGGAAPLLTAADLAEVVRQVGEHEQVVVANNYFSADFVAFTPADAIQRIALPSMDNDLAVRLQRDAGLTNLPLPRTPGTQFDVDTPTDLLILALHPGTGPHLRQFLEQASLDATRLARASRYLTDPNAEVIVSGRVGSAVLAHLETDLACRTRVFSEERGMRASGREARGEVRSLLGFYLQEVGPERFFAALADLGNAAFIDTRVLFHHLHLSPRAADRFYSDLLLPAEIQDPTLRAFTEAAAAAALPVVLGGHSLVAGGLWALADAAWQQRDAELASASRC